MATLSIKDPPFFFKCFSSGTWWCVVEFLSMSTGHPYLCSHALTVTRPWRIVNSLRKVRRQMSLWGSACVFVHFTNVNYMRSYKVYSFLLLPFDLCITLYYCITTNYRFIYITNSYVCHVAESTIKKLPWIDINHTSAVAITTFFISAKV